MAHGVSAVTCESTGVFPYQRACEDDTCRHDSEAQRATSLLLRLLMQNAVRSPERVAWL